MRKVGTALRFLVTGALFIVAGVFVFWGWLTLDNLWAAYKDSPDAVYITFAGLAFFFAALLVALGVWLLRTR